MAWKNAQRFIFMNKQIKLGVGCEWTVCVPICRQHNKIKILGWVESAQEQSWRAAYKLCNAKTTAIENVVDGHAT